MFDIGWTELLLIGVVALIVVGPKDLPVMFRTLGQFTGKARRMAREFQKAMEDAADESGVKDVSKDLRAMTSARKLGLDKLQDAAKSFDRWEPGTKPKGPATTELSKERAEAAAKIREATAAKATARKAAEAEAEAEAAELEPEPEPDEAPEHAAEPAAERSPAPQGPRDA